MNFKTSQRIPEFAIYIIVWLVIFIMPVLVSTSNTGQLNKQVFLGWLRLIPFIVIFIINTIWLLPEFLFKGKTGMYLFLVFVISLLVVIIWEYYFPHLRDLFNIGQVVRQREPGLLRGRPRPPIFNQVQEGIQRKRVPGQNQLPPRSHIISIFNQMVIAWLVVGFNTAIKITNRWFNDEQKKRELEKERLKSELAFLQNQISPHFFMNTLNNIHAQIDIDTKEAQSSIVTLSKMMRYLLYESEKGKTTLKKEVEFIRSYVDLMKLRVDENIEINLNISVQDDDMKLHPLLFISFVENAFKHGISYNEKSFIKIDLTQTMESINFSCINSLSVQNKITNPYSGVGLENIKKRLDLLYSGHYQLDIKETDSTFEVNLKIPADEN